MRRMLICIAVLPAIVASVSAAGAPSAKASQGESPPAAAEPKLLFAIIYRPGPAWRRGRPFIEQAGIREHYAYVRRLFDDGRVFAAGGLGNENGLILLYARSQEEADAVVAADPMVRAGSFEGEARRYRPAFISEGRLAATRE